MDLKVSQHILPIRVYFEDTDIGGIVHHSNYLKFFERGRIESWRSKGVELSSLYESSGLHFVIHSIEISYLKPAYLDQLLYVRTKLAEVSSASLVYHQSVYLRSSSVDEKENELENDDLIGPPLCKAILKLVCVDKTLKPRRLPDFFREGEH